MSDAGQQWGYGPDPGGPYGPPPGRGGAGPGGFGPGGVGPGGVGPRGSGPGGPYPGAARPGGARPGGSAPSAFGPGTFAPGALGRGNPVGPPSAGRPPAGTGRDPRPVGRDGPTPRHLAPSPWPGEAGAARAMPTRRRGLNWLMLVPAVMPLLVPLYNRDTPRLFGLPFFYWYQLACVFVTIATVTFVYLATKGRRPRW